jgi:hypothetical protein
VHYGGMSDDSSMSGDVAAWFEARGFRLSISDVDYSSDVRSSPADARLPHGITTPGSTSFHLTVGSSSAVTGAGNQRPMP